MKTLSRKIDGLLHKFEDMQYQSEGLIHDIKYLENIVKSTRLELDLMTKELKNLSSYHYSVEWYDMIQALDDEINVLTMIREKHMHKVCELKLKLLWTENMVEEICKWVSPSKA